MKNTKSQYPCEECISLAICKSTTEISCILVDEYCFMHDVDPGARGAYARAQYISDFFGFGGAGVVILDRTLLTAKIYKGSKMAGGYFK